MKMISLVGIVGALAVSAGCKDDEASAKPAPPTYGPVITADHMPEGYGALTFAASTEADVKKVLGEDAGREAHESLGGDMMVLLNDDPAVVLRKGDTQAWLVKQTEAEEPTLTRLVIKQEGICDRVGARLEGEAEATECPGTNEKFGEAKGGWKYCLGGPKADRNLTVECRKDQITYWVKRP